MPGRNPPIRKKTGPPPEFDPEKVADALRKANGLISFAAKRLRCDPKTVRSYIERYPEVAAAVDEARGVTVDLGESKLIEAVRAREAWAVCFLLKTQGKSRGYVERQEITGKDGEPIAIDDARSRLMAQVDSLHPAGGGEGGSGKAR